MYIACVFIAKGFEYTDLARHTPATPDEAVDTVLKILSGSMLVIATFAVGSMIAAFSSAASTATPRSFALVVSDDVSQNALSTFIGAFIFSIVAIVFEKRGFFHPPGRSALLALTVLIFAIVIVTFVRWVDRIARLGRLGETVVKVERATARTLRRRRIAPTLQCRPDSPESERWPAVSTTVVGYVQRVDVEALQRVARDEGLHIAVHAMPGVFADPGCVLGASQCSSPRSPNLGWRWRGPSGPWCCRKISKRCDCSRPVSLQVRPRIHQPERPDNPAIRRVSPKCPSYPPPPGLHWT
ncbi:MAG: DUF2254 family protein [Phycisphaerales bacterium]